MDEQYQIADQQTAPPQDDPKKKLWQKLNASGAYTKSYDEFNNQFNSQERIGKLYSALNSSGRYSKSQDEFTNQFFKPSQNTNLSLGGEKNQVNPSKYETKLNPQQEGQFQSWFDQQHKAGKIGDGDYDFYKKNGYGYDYDFRAAFLNGDNAAKNGHWSDIGKKPNHQTFSVESKYNGVDGYKGGTWNGDTFMPPKVATNQSNNFTIPHGNTTQALKDRERQLKFSPEADSKLNNTKPVSIDENDPVKSILNPLIQQHQTATKNFDPYRNIAVSDATVNKVLPTELVNKRAGEIKNKKIAENVATANLVNTQNAIRNQFDDVEKSRQVLDKIKANNGGVVPADNLTGKFATDKLIDYGNWSNKLKNSSIVFDAIDEERKRNPSFNAQYMELQKSGDDIPKELEGQLVSNYVNRHAKDLQTFVKENPDQKEDYEDLTNNFSNRYPEAALINVKSKMNQAIENKRSGWNLAHIGTGGFNSNVDKLATEVLSPDEQKLYNEQLKGDKGWVKTNDFLNSAARALGRGAENTKSSIGDLLGTNKLSNDIYSGLTDEASNTLPQSKGIRDVENIAGDFTGTIGWMALETATLKRLGVPIKIAEKAPVFNTFFHDIYRQGEMKFADKNKAKVSAIVNTAMYMWFTDMFPSAKVGAAIEKLKPQVDNIIKRAAANEGLATLKSRIADAATKTVISWGKGVGEMNAYNQINRVLDHALGLKGQQFEQAHPDDEAFSTTKQMLAGGFLPNLIHGVGRLSETKPNELANAINELKPNVYTTPFIDAIKAKDDAKISTYLKDIAEQASNPQSKTFTRNTFGDKIVDIATKLYPDAKSESINIKPAEETNPIGSKEDTPIINEGTENKDVNLQTQKTEQDANDILTGKKVFERFSPQEQHGLTEGGANHVEASLILSRGEGSGGQNNATPEAQENSIETYAKGKGIWTDNTTEELTQKYGEPIASGEEAIVWFDPKEGKVIKTQDTFQYENLQQKLDGITLHNSYFPEAPIKVLGFGKNAKGDFQVIVEQPHIKGEKLTPEEIKTHLENLGFKQDENGHFSNNDTIIEDVHTGNAIKTPEGNIIVIDPIMRLNTPEQGYGGKREKSNIISNSRGGEGVGDAVENKQPTNEIPIPTEGQSTPIKEANQNIGEAEKGEGESEEALKDVGSTVKALSELKEDDIDRVQKAYRKPYEKEEHLDVPPSVNEYKIVHSTVSGENYKKNKEATINAVKERIAKGEDGFKDLDLYGASPKEMLNAAKKFIELHENGGLAEYLKNGKKERDSYHNEEIAKAQRNLERSQMAFADLHNSQSPAEIAAAYHADKQLGNKTQLTETIESIFREKPTNKPTQPTEIKPEQPPIPKSNEGEPPTEPPTVEAGSGEEGNKVGVSHAALTDLAKRLNLKEPERGEFWTPEQYAQRGRQLLAAGADPKEVDNQNNALHDRISIARAHLENLTKEADAIARDNPQAIKGEEFNKKLAELNKYIETVKSLGTEAHRAFTALQGDRDLDTDSFVSVKRSIEENQDGKPATKAQEEKIQKLTEQNKKLTQRAEEAEKKLIEATDKVVGEATPKKTAKETAKSIADKIRKAKIHRPDIFSAGSPASVVWDSAVEIVAKTVEAGGKIADAIDRGVRYMQSTEWYKKLNDDKKKEAEKQFRYWHKENEIDDSKQKFEEKVRSGQSRSKMQKPLTEDEQMAQDQEELEKLQSRFVDKKENDNKFSNEEAKSVWDYAKRNYLDKGVSWKDMLGFVSRDSGLTIKQVASAIVSPKTKPLSNAMWKAQYDRTLAQSATRRYVEAQTENLGLKILKKVTGAIRGETVFGHSGIFIGTHASNVLLQPTKWKYVIPSFFKGWSLAYGKGSEARYEQFKFQFKNRPLYDLFQRAGLQNNVDLHNVEEYESSQKYLGKVGMSGQRGFTGLKYLRQLLAEHEWNKLSKAEQSEVDSKGVPVAARRIAGMTNLATGATNYKLTGMAGEALKEVSFAPGMEISRWGRLLGNPPKATWYALKLLYGKVSGKETLNTSNKVFLKVWAKRTGEGLATYAGLLIANAAIQNTLNPKNPINLTNPSKSDFLKPKFGDITLDPTNGLLSIGNFINGIFHIAKSAKKELHGDTRMQAIGKSAVGYARGKLSPAYSIATDFIDQQNFDRNVMPFSSDKPAAGKHKMSWLEYGVEHLPLPLSHTAHEMFNGAYENSDTATMPTTRKIIDGLVMGVISGGTGLRTGEFTNEGKPTPFTEEDKKDPVFKTFLDKGLELPNTVPTSENITDERNKVKRTLADYPKEIQDKYADTHKQILKQELATAISKGVFVNHYLNAKGESENEITFLKKDSKSKKVRVSDLDKIELEQVLHLAQSKATTKTKKKIFHYN